MVKPTSALMNNYVIMIHCNRIAINVILQNSQFRIIGAPVNWCPHNRCWFYWTSIVTQRICCLWYCLYIAILCYTIICLYNYAYNRGTDHESYAIFIINYLHNAEYVYIWLLVLIKGLVIPCTLQSVIINYIASVSYIFDFSYLPSSVSRPHCS